MHNKIMYVKDVVYHLNSGAVKTLPITVSLAGTDPEMNTCRGQILKI